MNSHLSTLCKITGFLLAISGAALFIYGLGTFAATKGSSLQGFGAVLLGYGCILLGLYVHPGLRRATEGGVAALRRITDRFFNL